MFAQNVPGDTDNTPTNIHAHSVHATKAQLLIGGYGNTGSVSNKLHPPWLNDEASVVKS